jgi:hypothetical protein
VAETVRGAHLIDWASDLRAPGSGVALVQRLHRMFDFLYAIGGSEMTQKVLPIFGFREVAQAWSGARPLRPLRQMLSHQCLDWKLPARFARNALWSLTPMRTGLKGWTIHALDLNEIEGDSPFTGAPSCARRPNAFFRYLKCCPVVCLSVFQIQNDGHDEGRMALSFLHKQARLLGIWLNHHSPEGLQAAYGLAQEAARKIASALEITAVGSTPVSAKAADSAGLRIRSYRPVYLLRRNGNLPSVPFEFQAADNDAVFLSEGRPVFLT